MQTDQSLRDRLLGQKYHTSNAAQAMPSFNDNSEDHKTQEEWFQYFHEIEEGDFTSLEDANHNFELWKAELISVKM